MRITIRSRLVIALMAVGLLSSLFAATALAEDPYYNQTAYFRYGANGYPSNINAAPNAYIGMYDVTPMFSGQYQGHLAQIKRQVNGVTPTFTISEGRIVNFVAFSSRSKSRLAKEWSFTTPPYKNFGDGNNILCQINYLSSNEKLRLSTGDSCAYGSGTRPLSDATVAFAKGAYGLASNKVGVFEAWPMESNQPSSLVKNTYVTLYDESGYQIAGPVTTGDRGIATFIVKRGQRFYVEAQKDGRFFGGRTRPYYPTQTSIEYFSADGKQLISAYDGSATYALRLNLYPQNSNVVPPNNYASPVIYSPTSGQVLSNYPRTATITWGAISGVSSYDYEVQCDVCRSPTWSSSYGIKTVNTNSVTTIPLAGDQQFRVHVRTRVNGNVGPWSEYRYFWYKTSPTQGALSTPNVTRPTSGEVFNSTYALVDWNPVSGASRYEYEIQCDSCGSPRWTVSYGIISTTSTRVQRDSLPTYQDFRVRVRAFDYQGSASAWSTYRYFSLRSGGQSGFAAPVITNPLNNARLSNYPRVVYATWTTVYNSMGYSAPTYEYEVMRSALTTTQYSLNCGEMCGSHFVNSPNAAITVPDDSDFQLRVRAQWNGTSGQWSDYRYFSFRTVAQPSLTAPVIQYPRDQDTYTSSPRRPSLLWNAVTGATGYQYEIICARCAGYVGTGIQYTEVTNPLSVALPQDNQYMVHVRAIRKNGVQDEVGPWSLYTLFWQYSTPIQY